jgi:hypothetical protein
MRLISECNKHDQTDGASAVVLSRQINNEKELPR